MGEAMKKRYKTKILGVIVAIVLTLSTLAATASAASKIETFEHKINIPTNKVWTIRLNKSLNSSIINSLGNYITVTSPRDGVIDVGLSYNEGTKAITITPPEGGYRTSSTYTIIVKEEIYDSLGTKINAPTVMEFSTVNSNNFNPSSIGEVSYYNLNYSLDTFANNQVNNRPVVVRYYGYNGSASKNDILQYTNPSVFQNDSFGIYQFLNLNYMEGITTDNLNNMLSGKGILSGMGQAFQDACRASNVSQPYAVSHALLETGNGASTLAKGVEYNGKIVYNFFGIGAIDSDPINKGAEMAYKQGWFSPEEAIKGGVKWIGDGYINSSYNQNTIYKMRWNGNSSGVPVHQYATDVAWAYKQVKNTMNMLNKFPNAKLRFDIPVYK